MEIIPIKFPLFPFKCKLWISTNFCVMLEKFSEYDIPKYIDKLINIVFDWFVYETSQGIAILI